MNTDHNGQDRRSCSDADVARLVMDAGPRPRLTDVEAARLRRAATEAWETEVRQRRNRRWSAMTALAASVVAGVAISWWIGNGNSLSTTERIAIAGVSRAVGGPRVVFEDSTNSVLRPGDIVRAGDRIFVEPTGGLAFELSNGMQIRIAGGSTVIARAEDTLVLETGRLYADSGVMGTDATSVTVHTAQAVVKDIGTQFQVITTDNETRVLVREGEVEVRHDATLLSAQSGDVVAVDAAGTVRHGEIAPDSAEWQWTLSVASNPEVDGRPVIDLLQWVARETGKTLVFADDGLEADARRILLRGTIGNLTPLQSLDAMLRATNLDYELTAQGAIVVKRRPR